MEPGDVKERANVCGEAIPVTVTSGVGTEFACAKASRTACLLASLLAKKSALSTFTPMVPENFRIPGGTGFFVAETVVVPGVVVVDDVIVVDVVHFQRSK